MNTTNILISGFGGQGVLFTGKFLAYEGMLEGMEVSWLPSYGPEMRGGTASCAVILSKTSIGSPLVSYPDILVAMNLPSLDRFEQSVQPGGMIFYDSSLVDRQVVRRDVKAFAVPATQMASDRGFTALANMIVVGKLLKESGLFPMDAAEKTVDKLVPARKQELIELNKTALRLGYAL